jgi:hypothetical protein
MDIQNAQLNWKTMWYTTSGPGANNVITSCGVTLMDANPDDSVPLSNTTLWGIENYDVTAPVLAKLSSNQGWKNIVRFDFKSPWLKKPEVRWDRCLWFINNLTLSIHTH